MSVKGAAISKLIEAIRQASLHGLINALDAGCDIEEADQHGLRGLPLRTACFSGKVEIVRALIERGADVNAAGYDGPGMPLRLARRAGNSDIIRLLLASGATVPPDVTLPADLLAEPEIPEIPEQPVISIPEIPAMEFTLAPKESSLADFLPELPASQPAPSPENYQIDEEVDIRASYGLDTNLLNMDMQRADEGADQAGQPQDAAKTPGEQKKGGFWRSGRNS
ncbi:MAG: ankyrin repeat domain-containing protein [Azonexus sp.]